MIKKPIALIFVSIMLASPALAGWEIKAKFMEEPARSPQRGVSTKTGKDSKTAEEAGSSDTLNFTILLDGPRLKWINDKEPDSFFIVDLEKQSYIVVGFVKEETANESSRKNTSRAQKIAITGTLDEFLSLMSRFMEATKAMMEVMKTQMPKQPSPPRSESATKTDFLVKPGLPGKTIAGCKTNGVSLITMETGVSHSEGAQKTEMSATTKSVTDLYMCPEIDIAYLIPYLEAIYKKIADWGKKWEATFAEVMGMEISGDEKANLMSAPFIAGKYEDATKIWKSIAGFPFLVVEASEGKETSHGWFEVTSYKSREIAPTEFAVPKGYHIKKLEELFGEMMGGLMGGM